MSQNETIIVDAYRRQAKFTHVSDNNYKGLIINALPGLHQFVGDIAAQSFAPGAQILDLASGSGAMCLRLHDFGFCPTACDLVDENFRLHGKIPFLSANLNRTFHALFQCNFDGIIAAEIIEHLENPRHFLRECYSALKPGGHLILTTPNVDSALARGELVRSGDFKWFGPTSYATSGHITPLPLLMLMRALKEAKFDVVKVTSFGKPLESDWIGWKMKLLMVLLRAVDGIGAQQGEILVLVARRPDVLSSPADI